MRAFSGSAPPRIGAEPHLLVVRLAELDVVEDVEVPGVSPSSSSQISGPVTLKWTFIGSSCS